MNTKISNMSPSSALDSQTLRQRIAAAVQGMEYGQISIIIQGGRVIQIERTEKFRLPKVEGRYGDGI